MVEVTATVRNAMGIHCRPSAVIVKESRAFRGNLEVISAHRRCDPRSIMGLISMGLAQGESVTIRLSGRGEKSFAPRVVELFERRFDFSPDAHSVSPLRQPSPLGSS